VARAAGPAGAPRVLLGRDFLSQPFLDAFVPRIASAFDAVARNPGHSVVLWRPTSFWAPKILADRGGPTWRRLVGRGLPMGDAEIEALERCADATLEAQIHRVVRVPGVPSAKTASCPPCCSTAIPARRATVWARSCA